MRLIIAAFLALAAYNVPTELSAAEGSDGPALMIVFDGSGSMWGELPGKRQPKHELAHNYLSRLLPTLPKNLRYGLTVFGNGCSGADVRQAPTSGGTRFVLKGVETTNPRGKGPISKALLQAAASIEPGRPASIVLIHDGPDNCPADPCNAAATIAKSHPGLAIHMVSIALKNQTARAMSCIAEKTNGKQFRASNAKQLSVALKDALSAASAPVSRKPKEQTRTSKLATPSGEPVANPPEKPTGPPRIRVTASLAPGRPVLDVPVRWHIAGLGDDNKIVLSGNSPTISRPVPPGNYKVRAQIGLVTAEQELKVGKVGTTAATVPLDAAIARVSVRPRPGANDITDATVTISQNAASRSASFLMTRDTSKPFYLPAGDYQITIEKGHARAADTITLQPGDDRAIDAILGSGQLDLSALSAERGEAVEDVTYEIAVDDPDAPAGRRVLIRSAAPAPSFILPAGTYYVTVRAGLAEKRQLFAVGAGDTVDGTITMDLARVRLTATVEDRSLDPQTPVFFQVFHADDTEKTPIGSSTLHNPEFVLPAANYRLRTTIGTQNAVSETEVTLAPGDDRQIDLNVSVARLNLRTVRLPNTRAVLWRIRTPDKRILWSANQSEPKALLAPGNYLIERDIGGKRTTRAISLNVGETRTVEFGSP